MTTKPKTPATDLAKIAAALKLPIETGLDGILAAINKIVDDNILDPTYETMLREKLAAGLPHHIAVIATKKQMAHDRQLAAERLGQ